MKYLITFWLIIISLSGNAAYMLIPMDETQTNHLKAYGIAYWVLEQEVEVDWLLNFKGGSLLQAMCRVGHIMKFHLSHPHRI